ncbi:MAG: MgtC/SapB family protein [Gemmatimonadota bacterium]
MLDLALGFDLLLATLVGLAVGLEREWSGHTSGPDARFAGIRTFALLGTVGGFAGWFARTDQPALGVAVAAGAMVFVVAAFMAAMRRHGTTADSTTEVAGLVVIVIGITAGLGHRAIASAAATLVVVLLTEKSALQRASQRLDANELRATVQFAVMALVILPLLPNRTFGPYDAFNPRQLWWVVLLFSGLNFAGYIARRVVGETRGLGITGLLGGLVSSTAVTFNFSRRSRHDNALAQPLAFGVAAACTVLLPRLVVVAAVLQPRLLGELVPLLAPPFVAGTALLAGALWRDRDRGRTQAAEASTTTHDPLQNPLAVWSSLQMAVAFQVVLFAVAWVQASVGNPGVLASAGLLGLTDMDALTFAMTQLASDNAQTHLAALAIAIGVISNTILKSTVVLTLGSARFRYLAITALAAIGAASAAALWWRW